MKNFKHLLFIVITIALIIPFVSCSDDNDGPLLKKKLPTLITWIKSGKNESAEFVYDSQNRPIQYSESVYLNAGDSDKSDTKYVFTYNSSGDLVSMNYYENENQIYTSEFIYNNNIVEWFVEPVDDEPYSIEMILNEKKQVIEKTFYPYGTKHIFEYDNNGNLKIHDYYIAGVNNDGIYQRFEYQYDDKKGIMSEINMPSWFFLLFRYGIINQHSFENNMSKYSIKNYNEDGNIESTGATNNYVISYDESGYPISYGYLFLYKITYQDID